MDYGRNTAPRRHSRGARPWGVSASPGSRLGGATQARCSGAYFNTGAKKSASAGALKARESKTPVMHKSVARSIWAIGNT